MGDSARYMYAITRGERGSFGDVTGLGGARLEVVEHRGLVAVVSDVDLDEFGEEPLRTNLEDLEWLERVVRVHDAVIHAVTASGPTAPLRLATICLDDDGVRRRLDEWFSALQQVLDRVEGRMEWSVKVFAPPENTKPPEPGAGSGASGIEYLRRKKEASARRSEAHEAAARTGQLVHEELASVAVASRRLHPQDPRLTGHSGLMLLNGAYLVDSGDTPAFETRLSDLVRSHPSLEISCAGPWPPYSFAMLEQR